MMQEEEADQGPSLTGLSNEDALDILGTLIDLAGNEAKPNLAAHALTMADELESRGLPPDQCALLDYFRANAWACRYQERLADHEATWEFEQPEIRQQVLLLRRAAHGDGFQMLSALHRCQILTNLGNALETLGRFIEARSNWTEALAIHPAFWMARGNRGRALMSYARGLYDPGHRRVFAYRAHQELIQAIEQLNLHPELGDVRLREYFAEEASKIKRAVDVAAIAATYQPEKGSLGRGQKERAYRQWCLTKTLFLNPLNDIEQAPIAASDVLNLPSFVLPFDEPPVVLGMFNELKQAFATARWLLWEGLSRDATHFSDRGVSLAFTLDYPAYGLSVEQVKIAFRMAYSTFDKVAYFLNRYLGLDIKANQVSFRSLWHDKAQGQMREQISNSKNLPLRGLYWLSKDLFEEGMRESTDPDARGSAELRNQLEHKYVKVHEFGLSDSEHAGEFSDPFAHAILRADLEKRTLKLLQLARSALIYLCLAMHHEERKRKATDGGLAVPMGVDTWNDEWKR